MGDHTHYPALDGFRGLAVLLVIGHHTLLFSKSSPAGSLESFLYAFMREGWMGVDLFFVLSGFLITRILLGIRHSGEGPGHFYLRRSLRILPLYYLLILLVCVILPFWFPFQLHSYQEQQFWFWTHLQNLHIALEGKFALPLLEHTWSLGIEEQFYLLWPWIVLKAPQSWLKWIMILMISASLSLRVGLTLHGFNFANIYTFTPARLDGLMLGALLAHFMNRGLIDHKWFRPGFCALLIGGLLLRILAPAPLGHSQLPFGNLAWSLVGVGIMALSLKGGSSSILTKALSFTPLQIIGRQSYGLYLIHQPIYVIIGDVFAGTGNSALVSWVLLSITALPLSLALSWVSLHYYERWFLNLGRKLLTPIRV